jgi:uncharacterized protein YbaR (Trm112 family)
MNFNKKLLDIIACPVCKGKLVLHQVSVEGVDTPESSDSESDSNNASYELVCRFDRLAYPIEDGIPVLLESDGRELSLDELEKVKSHD